MQKLWTKEELPKELPLLGGLVPADQGHIRLCLWQKITVPGAGSFAKKLPISGMNAEELLANQSQRQSAEEQASYVGVVLPRQEETPIGQVTYQSGVYRFALPVYAAEALSNRWVVRGYLPLDNGKFAVMAGRSHRAAVVAGILVALAAGTAACFTAIYGWETVLQTLRGWIAALQ